MVNTNIISLAVKGTCLYMCPLEEVRMRQRENLIHPLENYQDRHGQQRNSSDPQRMVKSFSRSAAGQIIKPTQVRPLPILKKTVKYLLEVVCANATVPWLDVFDFVSDRLRSVRQDITIQNLSGTSVVPILLSISRFYTYAHYRLSSQDKCASFDSFLSMKQLNECLLTLMVTLQDLNYEFELEKKCDKYKDIECYIDDDSYSYDDSCDTDSKPTEVRSSECFDQIKVTNKDCDFAINLSENKLQGLPIRFNNMKINDDSGPATVLGHCSNEIPSHSVTSKDSDTVRIIEPNSSISTTLDSTDSIVDKAVTITNSELNLDKNMSETADCENLYSYTNIRPNIGKSSNVEILQMNEYDESNLASTLTRYSIQEEIICLYLILNVGEVDALSHVMELPRKLKERPLLARVLQCCLTEWSIGNCYPLLHLANDLPIILQCALHCISCKLQRRILGILSVSHSSSVLSFDLQHLSNILSVSSAQETQELCQHYGIHTQQSEVVKFAKQDFLWRADVAKPLKCKTLDKKLQDMTYADLLLTMNERINE